MPDTNQGSVRPIEIEREMQDSFLEYAMSVIVARALPDVRDGLKPVHRRILFSMFDSGIRPGTPFRKSARVIGDVWLSNLVAWVTRRASADDVSNHLELAARLLLR